MATSLHNLSDYDPANVPDASNMCFGIVVVLRHSSGGMES